MANDRQLRQLADLTHDIDMLVFRLERTPPKGREDLLGERQATRKELERLRGVLNDLLRDLEF